MIENKDVDFDVDYEEKENSVFKAKKPKKIWMPGKNYFRIIIEIFVVLIIFAIFFVLYNRDWFGLSNTPSKNYFSILQSEDQYDCGDKFAEAESLKPLSLAEIDAKTKELNTLGESLKNEKIALEKEKASVTDELSGIIYKNKIDDYNLRLESYTRDLQKHKKEIDGYNQKVQAYYDFLKGSCTLVK